nr:MAG TPA: hypothetical protein [Caudoviricetes sp.]
MFATLLRVACCDCMVTRNSVFCQALLRVFCDLHKTLLRVLCILHCCVFLPYNV